MPLFRKAGEAIEDETDEVFSDLIANRIAGRVVERLGGSVISSAFPAEVGDWIRDAVKNGAYLYRFTIPMVGPTAIFVEYRINPDGTIIQEFQDTNGRPFWHGTFRPVEAP
jgi:hypothetical protein